VWQHTLRACYLTEAWVLVHQAIKFMVLTKVASIPIKNLPLTFFLMA
jgi:hypothetical protein